MIDKRVEIAAKYLRSLAISEESEADGTPLKPMANFRTAAGGVLVLADQVLFSTENIARALEKCGYNPDQYLQMFERVSAELRNGAPRVFVIDDLRQAWAEGHEDGFWDGRTSGGANAPEQVEKLPFRFGFSFTEEEVQTARTAGYAVGFQNGVLSSGSRPAGEKVLLGKEHAEANNPFLLPEAAEAKHTMWCRGDEHEGPCKRGVLTGTERGDDDE